MTYNPKTTRLFHQFLKGITKVKGGGDQTFMQMKFGYAPPLLQGVKFLFYPIFLSILLFFLFFLAISSYFSYFLAILKKDLLVYFKLFTLFTLFVKLNSMYQRNIRPKQKRGIIRWILHNTLEGQWPIICFELSSEKALANLLLFYYTGKPIVISHW